MASDPSIDRIRAIRLELAREHDYDLDAIFDTFGRMERESGLEPDDPPRRPVHRYARVEKRCFPRNRRKRETER